MGKYDFKNQKELADLLIEKLTNSGLFSSVTISGSLASAEWDVLSDIDISITSIHKNPKDAIEDAVQIISTSSGIWFTDWALSLLPDKHVVSVFIHGVPIFWYIDISVGKDPAWPEIKRSDIEQDPILHIFKLWICNAKQQLRNNNERNFVDSMYNKLFSSANQADDNLYKFRKTLDWLHS